MMIHRESVTPFPTLSPLPHDPGPRGRGRVCPRVKWGQHARPDRPGTSVAADEAVTLRRLENDIGHSHSQNRMGPVVVSADPRESSDATRWSHDLGLYDRVRISTPSSNPRSAPPRQCSVVTTTLPVITSAACRCFIAGTEFRPPTRATFAHDPARVGHESAYVSIRR
jgi:hypothetical protein